MQEFLLAIHRDLTTSNPSPSQEQMKTALKPYQQWIGDLKQKGMLTDMPRRWDTDGRFVTRDNTVHKGPYAEKKESIGGLFLIKANDYDEAVEAARQCPIIPFGAIVEVRMAMPTI